MERNDRNHPSNRGPNEIPDDPIFPDDIEEDGAEDPEDVTRPENATSAEEQFRAGGFPKIHRFSSAAKSVCSKRCSTAMTQLNRVWLRVNEAAREIVVKERFLTAIDARNIVAGILRRERDERPTTEAVDHLAAELKKLVAQARLL